MKNIRIVLPALLLTLLAGFRLQAQQIDSLKFFTDEQIIETQLTTDIRALQNQKGEDVFQEASITMNMPDGAVISENIQVGARGKFRRGYCRIPPMMLNFRTAGAPQLSSLGKLKLVLACSSSAADEELLLKEFVVYKIYNLLTDKSFRVRMLKVTYNDSKGKNKSFTQHAFLIEDDGDMARRNGCKKKEHGQYLTDATDRETMTLVAIFQYMIGNTDWAVPNGHNVKLVFNRKEDFMPPYVIPYDFDYCGLVDAGYAVPNEIIGTEKVTERVYRGFPRSMEEIQATLEIFRAKKEAILSQIRNFSLLSEKVRGGMIRYLEQFFRLIENKSEVKSAFIDNARTS